MFHISSVAMFFSTAAVLGAWPAMMTMQTWHHTLTEVLKACLKAQFLNTSCVHFTVE